MGNRDIWKISRRPSSTSSYQGNMYILIATESARNPVKKGAKVWSGQSLSVSGTCSFCTFLIIKVFESTLLRLPCNPGRFEMSRHCREDDDDGGGPATKVPRESIDDNPTRRHTRSSLPALDLEKCLLCDSKKKNEKLLKPRGTYPLYLGVFPNDSTQRCSNTFFSLLVMILEY